MKHTIINRWNDEEPEVIECDHGGGDRIIEVAGYIPKEEQLRLLVQSGDALERYRQSLFPDKDDGTAVPPEYDPTSRKDYDYFDYHADVVYVQKRLEEQQRDFQNSTAKKAVEKTAEQTITPPASAGETPKGEGA